MLCYDNFVINTNFFTRIVHDNLNLIFIKNVLCMKNLYSFERCILYKNRIFNKNHGWNVHCMETVKDTLDISWMVDNSSNYWHNSFWNRSKEIKLTFDHIQRHDGGYLRHGLPQLHLEVLPPLLLSLGTFPVPGDLQVTDGVHSDRNARVGGDRAEDLLVWQPCLASISTSLPEGSKMTKRWKTVV